MLTSRNEILPLLSTDSGIDLPVTVILTVILEMSDMAHEPNWWKHFCECQILKCHFYPKHIPCFYTDSTYRFLQHSIGHTTL